jgi:HNH endonuclease
VCEMCCRRDGSFNGAWKGGKTKHHAGYLMIRVPQHPRIATMKSKYVFEHILVVEDLLGRYLTADETVHHRNGVRDDNRPQNLELWVKAQPSGIRVDDAIDWAWEILARYAGLEQLERPAGADRSSDSWR